jgi:hypothetical protein
MGSHFFGALYSMYAITLNELKAFLKMSAQEGQSGAMQEVSLIIPHRHPRSRLNQFQHP